MKTALRFLVPLLILSLQFYPKIVISSTQDSHYVMHSCEKSNDTYVIGSTFQSILNNTLLSVLPAKALKTAFANYTEGTGIDQVNAIFYCRGDVDPLECHDCVVAAADKVAQRCQFQKEAVVWFEECTLRYSNRSILFIDEERPLYIYTNYTGIVNDDLLNHLDDEFSSAMDELIKQAASFRNPQCFATTQLNVSSTKVLHCSVQCSPYISGAPCERCLKSALRQRDKWADTMIFMPSCFIRVDLYNTTQTAPPPPPGGDKGLTPAMIVGISLGCGMFAIVAVLVAYCCYIRYWPYSAGQRTEPRIFTYIQLAVATNGFVKRKILGEGGFGRVYRGDLRGQKVAIKRIKEVWGTASRQLRCTAQFRKEVENNFFAVHDNIVKVVGYCHQGDRKLLVCELVENSSLEDHLHGTKHGILTWENRNKIAVGCAKGLRCLHEECDLKIIHRDIKPSNILLDFDYEPKLADFGLSTVVFPDDASYVDTIAKGTFGYLDPQYFDSNRLTEKSDVYSFGVVLLGLITGKKPNSFPDDPGNILFLLLQEFPDFAFDGPIASTSDRDVQVLALDGAEETAPDVPKDSNLEKYVGSVLQILRRRDMKEMARMMICAAMCVHPSRDFRLSMSQVVQLLEGGSLPSSDVAQMMASVGWSRSTKPESSTSCLELAELKQLATRVLMHV